MTNRRDESSDTDDKNLQSDLPDIRTIPVSKVVRDILEETDKDPTDKKGTS